MSLLRRIAISLIDRNAHFDRVRWESVSTVNREDLVQILSTRFRGLRVIPLAAIPDVEKGEVLYDSRGLGSLQLQRREGC